MGDRRRSRELALQVLYQMEHGTEDPAAAFDLFAANFNAPAGAVAYARSLVTGVHQRRQEIDDHLQAASRSWRLERMSRVDRNILRMACLEMLAADPTTPPKVIINEAVELAKRFAGDESPGFINAILDTLRSRLGTGDA